MQKPLISVILPVFNAEKYLSESIESILNQTIRDFEFILINDGSSDSSEKIILSYNDERIVYIKNEQNLRLIKTLNIGIKAAKGHYISRMDADDIAFPNLFEQQLEVFNNNKNVDIVNIRSFILSENGLTYYSSNTTITVNYDVHQHIIFLQNLISHPGIMVKSSILKRHQYCDNENDIPFQDVDLWFRLLKHGHHCHTIEKCLLFYRNTPTGITNTLRNNRLTKRVKYCQEILNTDYVPIFTEETLKIILGKYELANLRELIRLNKTLTKYIGYIRSNKSISTNGISDLSYWKIQLLFVTSTMAIRNNGWYEKIKLLTYMGVNFPLWITNKKWRAKFGRIIFNHKRYR